MARRGVLNLVGVACSGIFSFVLLLTFTRTLSTSTYGALATVIALFTIVSNVGELGADTGFLREIPRLRVTARRRDIRIALVVGLGPILLVGVLSAVTAFAFAPLIVEALIGSQPDREVAQGLLRAASAAGPARCRFRPRHLAHRRRLGIATGARLRRGPRRSCTPGPPCRGAWPE
jgi:O-antigen/teichoic acid export membrane protein